MYWADDMMGLAAAAGATAGHPGVYIASLFKLQLAVQDEQDAARLRWARARGLAPASSSSSSGDSGNDKPGSSAASTTSEELGDVEEEEVISGPRGLQDRLLA